MVGTRHARRTGRKVVTPFLSAANWAGYGLHPRGNFFLDAFTQAASSQKWLEGHPGRHEEWFYLEYGMNLQRRFFDHFLKGEENGWDSEPRVWLQIPSTLHRCRRTSQGERVAARGDGVDEVATWMPAYGPVRSTPRAPPAEDGHQPIRSL